MVSNISVYRAAFQYGVKMSEGRKTRRFGGMSGKAKEKAKLDREWQQISAVSGSYTLGMLVLFPDWITRVRPHLTNHLLDNKFLPTKKCRMS